MRPSVGQGAQAGDRVVDRVQAGGACLVRTPFLLTLHPDDHVIEVGEQFVGHQVDVRESTDGRPQAAHGGECDAGTGQRNHVVPVAAHACPGSAGQVAAGGLDGGLFGHLVLEQAALERERRGTLVGVATSVVDVHGCSGRDLVGQEQILVVERDCGSVAEELHEAQGGSAGPQRDQEH
jgi:hypothetical protein